MQSEGTSDSSCLTSIPAPAAGQGSVLPMIKAVKMFRIFKVVKGLKFVNRLSRLRRAQGVESLTVAIGVLKSVFVMLFTAHVLGCVFIAIASDSPEQNWLLHYAPGSLDDPIWTRYVISVYWAIVTIRCHGGY